LANLRLRLESTKTAPLDHTKSESDVNNADNPKKDGEDQIENLKQRVALLESQLEAAQLMNQHGNQSDDPIGLKINEVKHLQELLEEARHSSKVLELEVERRQSEAQDGWAAAARLQQYFRNLHNILKDTKLTDEDADNDEEDDGDVEEDSGEPSALAGKINAKVELIKNCYEDLLAINVKQDENSLQLSKRIEYYEHELRTRTTTPVDTAAGPAMECLQREIENLNHQLKELETSYQEICDDSHKWQQAYKEILVINENRDSGVISQVGSSQPSSHLGSSDTDPRSPDLVDSPVVQKSSFFKDSSTDDLASQLSDARSELEVLHKRINEVQREKKDLEAEFVELKENYSLLSSQSQTVGRWMCMVPLAVLVLAVLIAFRPTE